MELMNCKFTFLIADSIETGKEDDQVEGTADQEEYTEYSTTVHKQT